MKSKNIFFLFISLSFFSTAIKSQDAFAIIDIMNNYEEGSTPGSYYYLFKLSGNHTLQQINSFIQKSKNNKYVIDISVTKLTNSYDVRLLCDKKTESISSFFRDYLIEVSIDYLLIDNNKIKTIDYYDYLSLKFNHKELSN